ncbi:putative molybdenum carrier protein [Candidatus Riflebacteria bacterium]
MGLEKIVSGGQTGADQGALDAAIESNFPYTGFLPGGRLTEDGRLSDRYALKEMFGASYAERTLQNILISDATLILSHGPITEGSALTRKLARQHKKPCLHIDFNKITFNQALDKAKNWILSKRIKILNVAGPRASKDPEIYPASYQMIKELIHEPARQF